MSELSVLIVDDEPYARKRIRKLLESESGIGSVEECDSGAAAVRRVAGKPPDLLFLDIQMPEMDGFEVIRRLGPEAVPAVIFVTAYDQFALDAFEAQAVDYLLKPVDEDRFRAAVERARLLVQGKRRSDWSSRVEGLLRDFPAQPGKSSLGPASGRDNWLARVVIKTPQRMFFVPTAEIDYISAAGKYSEVHVSGKTHLVGKSIGRLERELDPSRFIRIHRSTLINTERIAEMRLYSPGKYLFLLKGGARVSSSRSYAPAVRELLGE